MHLQSIMINVLIVIDHQTNIIFIYNFIFSYNNYPKNEIFLLKSFNIVFNKSIYSSSGKTVVIMGFPSLSTNTVIPDPTVLL